MFASRFDPSAIVEIDDSSRKRLPLKRKLSQSEGEDDEEGSDDDSEDKSDSDDSSDDDNSDNDGSEDDLSSDEGERDEAERDEDSEKGPQERGDVNEPQDEEMKDAYEPIEPREQAHESKFNSIISRFNKSIIKSSNLARSDAESEEEEEEVDEHELAPLPQPELPRDQKLSRQQLSKNLDWLSKPIFIHPNSTKPFDEFPLLNSKIKQNLKSLNCKHAFATQIKTLEILLPEISNSLNPMAHKGDVLVNASTGSGKTLAYTIPVVQSLAGRVVPRVRAIIIVPTKPLIQQVYKTFTSISKTFALNIVTLGKNDISLNEEHLKVLKNVPDVIITTPGRLVDHLNLGSFDLKSLRWCIIDEADRLLNQSFQDWLNVLFLKLNELETENVSKVYQKRLIKMIFSATLTTDSGKLSNLKFHNPRLIIVNDQDKVLESDKMFTLPNKLKEYSIILSSTKSSAIKPLILLNLLRYLQYPSNVLVFTKSNESTLRLSRLLTILSTKYSLSLVIANINSQLSAQSKNKIFEDFTTGKINILISTDLISRGIDISTIKHVMNYDLPNSSREYVHRVGRTARAEMDGEAYSLVLGKGELKFWKSMNLDINRSSDITELNQVVNPENTISEFSATLYEEALKDLEKEVIKKS